MLSLPNGCRCGKISVFPKNWKSPSASLSKKWYITYRFYDPTQPKPYQVTIKGMNQYKVYADRRSATETLLEHEQNQLRQGYNPFHSTILFNGQDGDIDQMTPFIPALRWVLSVMDKSPKTKTEIRSAIKGVEAAAAICGFESIPISTITRKHIKKVLITCKDVVPGWSNNRFNSYRSYLMMLFNELIEHEATEIDPVTKIKKLKTVRKIRKTLTKAQRVLIDQHLKNRSYNFWRFTNIFFHSGARETELMQLKKNQVDIEKQEYRVFIMKGSQPTEVVKVIKTIALPLWREVLSETGADSDFVFSKGLKPGPNPISASQINRRWKRFVKSDPKKGGLGINVDFYALKHSNLDEISAELNAKAAAEMAGHKTPVITLKHYLVNEDERQRQKLKDVANSFT